MLASCELNSPKVEVSPNLGIYLIRGFSSYISHPTSVIVTVTSTTLVCLISVGYHLELRIAIAFY